MRAKTTKLRTDSPPNSTEICPSSRRCRPAVTSDNATGSPSAKAYQRVRTRHRTSRPSRSLTPVLPSATAATTIAARAGPNRAGNPQSGDTDTRGIKGHVRAHARTKNAISGWRLTVARTELIVASCSRLQWQEHRRDQVADEGGRRSRPPDHVDAEVAVACLPPVLRRRIDLPPQKDPIEGLGHEGRGEHRAAPEREQSDRGQQEGGAERGPAQQHEHRDGREGRG